MKQEELFSYNNIYQMIFIPIYEAALYQDLSAEKSDLMEDKAYYFFLLKGI